MTIISKLAKKVFLRQSGQINQSSFITLDSPKPQDVAHLESSLELYGWAYTPESQDTQLEVFIDDQLVGHLSLTIPRPDVAEYLGLNHIPNCGFHGQVLMPEITPGESTLTLSLTKADGHQFIHQQQINVVDNPIHFGLDHPKVEAELRSNVFLLEGWTYSLNGEITRIDVEIGTQHVATLSTGVPRSDIGHEAGAYAGFQHVIWLDEFESLSPGNYALSIIVEDTDGYAFTHQQQLTLPVSPIYYSLDKPQIDETLRTNLLEVSGWAFSKSGEIQDIKIFADESLKSPLAIFNTDVYRPDLAEVFDQFSLLYAGFRTLVAINEPIADDCIVYVVIRDTEGYEIIHRLPVNIIKSPFTFALDNPLSAELLNTNLIEVSGFAYSSSSKLERIVALIDDNPEPVATLQMGILRPDLIKNGVKPSFKNAGFHGVVLLDKLGLSPGDHALTLVLEDDDGYRFAHQQQFHLLERAIISVVDAPLNGATIKSNLIDIRGWAYSTFADIQSIEVFLDGMEKPLAEIKTGFDRPDLVRATQRFEHQQAGFQGSVDVADIDPGEHILTLKIRDGAGNHYNQSLQITLLENPVEIDLNELPNENQVIKGNQVRLVGKAYSAWSKIAYVDFSITGKHPQTVSNRSEKRLTLVRELYDLDFTEHLLFNDLEPGEYELRMAATDTKGLQYVRSISVIVPDLTFLLVVDHPSSEHKLQSNLLDITGWVFSGARSIECVCVFIDKTIIAEFVPTIDRPDLGLVNPWMTDTRIGFKHSAWVDGIPSGTYDLRFVVQDSDGNEFHQYQSITLEESPIQLSVNTTGEDDTSGDNLLRLSGFVQSYGDKVTQIAAFLRKLDDVEDEADES